MAIDRKRIEEIRLRKEQREREARRRLYMLRRAVLALIALGIIIAVILGIRGCVKSAQEKRAAEEARLAAEEAAKPTPTPAPVFNENGINETFYTNCAFFGNSFIEGMTVYGLVPDDTDYITKVGLTVSQAMTDATDESNVPAVEELTSGKQYDKIFMMFGENEVGWIGDSFFEQYEALVNRVKDAQPNAKIYLLSITPISKKVSDENVDELNTDNVKAYNSGIRTVARNTGSIYVDLFPVLADKNGYLPDNAATDGVHFGEDYYIKCLKHIQELV